MFNKVNAMGKGFPLENVHLGQQSFIHSCNLKESMVVVVWVNVLIQSLTICFVLVLGPIIEISERVKNIVDLQTVKYYMILDDVKQVEITKMISLILKTRKQIIDETRNHP